MNGTNFAGNASKQIGDLSRLKTQDKSSVVNAINEASESAAAAQQAASSTEGYVQELKSAIEALPDGQAVTAEVAAHTLKLTELQREVGIRPTISWEMGAIASATGEDVPSTQRIRSSFFSVKAGDNISFTIGGVFVFEYSQPSASSLIVHSGAWVGSPYVVKNNGYIRLVRRWSANNEEIDESKKTQLIDDTKIPPIGIIGELENLTPKVLKNVSNVEGLRREIGVSPLVVTFASSLPVGLLNPTNGAVNSTYTGYRTTDFVPLDIYTKCDFEGLFPNTGGLCGICLYDTNKAFVACPQERVTSGTITLSDYPSAKYVRFSSGDGGISPAKAKLYTDGNNMTSNIERISSDVMGIQSQLSHLPAGRVFYVKKDGTGDFTRIVEAVHEAVKTADSVVYVYEGTYDIIEEMKELYGGDFWTNYASPHPSYDMYLYNRIKLVLARKADIKCWYDGTNDNVKKNFSIFNTYLGGCSIYGGVIEGANIRYLIHDERGASTDAYTNKFDCCRMVFDNSQNTAWSSKQCIGGGLGRCGIIEITNCDFVSVGIVYDRVVSYHNNTASDSQSTIIVTGNRFINGTFALTWWGTSTIVTRAFVSNNLLKAEPIHRAENSATYDVHNTELIAWNNVIA